MKFVHHPDAALHRPSTYFNKGQLRALPEKPERLGALAALVETRGGALIRPDDYGSAPRAAVHTPAYLAFLETAHARWMAEGGMGDVVLPNVHKMQRVPSYPASIVGQAGWHMYDTACPIDAHTWTATCAATNAAIHAARLVATGADRAAYALCRPPGHHATRDMAGGFCYLNHVAVAAESVLPILRSQGKAARVAILDVDVHHGNGTQDIFYERDDVFFVSVHGDPAQFYPHMAGYEQERGIGRGEGYTLNLPLPIGSDEATVLAAIGRSLDTIARFAPDMLFLSLGFDTFINDPLAAFGVTTPGFAKMAALIAKAGLPTVLVQEGGYAVDDLAANLGSFLDGYESAMA
ncbi:histone deacetylase family protein [Azospirillum doebereinerae]|uniref:Histone deacetylase family protein n=1 Tax=Azospirillum doebereinerae TaxID=92933 RepID=A0A3S0V5S3_9PROT|nr:histone deacetylase family protein [Azospirillum doebereinerae]RUQ69762.1 histone deacetylase family protein [Azospirillum doebereinerae]